MTTKPPPIGCKTKELKRQVYLQAMGIPIWFPRNPLQGAVHASALYPFAKHANQINAQRQRMLTAFFRNKRIETQLPTDHTVPSISTMKAPIQDQVQFNDNQAYSFTLDIHNSHSVIIPCKEMMPLKKSLLQKSKDKNNTSPFQLSMLLVQKDVLVVFDKPYDDDRLVPRNHKTLLCNLLQALNFPYKTESNMSVFSWPAISPKQKQPSKVYAEDHAYAVNIIKEYIQINFIGNKIKLYILLGKMAGRLITGLMSAELESIRGFYYDSELSTHYLTSYSLNDMLNNPAIKKKVWQDMSPIIK